MDAGILFNNNAETVVIGNSRIEWQPTNDKLDRLWEMDYFLTLFLHDIWNRTMELPR